MQQNKALFESLFRRKPDDQEIKNFLAEITAAHPYFSPAQFFLLQQTTEGTEAFEKQAVKTNIFFNNPLWLNFQLQQAKPGTVIEIKEPEAAVQGLPVTAVTQEPEIMEETEPVKEAPPVTESVLEIHTEPEPLKEEQPVNEYIHDQVPEEEEGPEPMKIELKLPEEIVTNNDAPVFEPMHLVDYFASQGIKLSEEVQSGDKLGKQLKSFTEWLKTMKKVHAAGPVSEAIQTDTSVEAMAELSNRENDVITEAMAEVFARQGKTAKATEVYQKLSLLNPAKSAYFAAKIETLKGV